MIVDFHVHSTASDGTVSPGELAAMGLSFDAMALTDHDNSDGVKEFLSSCGCKRIAGIELSIDPGERFDTFHLLGLGIDCENAALKKYLKRILEGRNARNEKIIENFDRIGIHIEPDDIARYAHGEVLARPHFAKWLVDHGYSPDVKTAFADYMLPDSPKRTRCYEKRYHPSQEESFSVIHNAGGLAIMAHPKYWRRAWRARGVNFNKAEKELRALKERGLDGIEAIYGANTIEENVKFSRISKALGYLMTAGSDFHGANKPNIQLGMNVTEEYITPFLEAVGLV